MIRDDDSEETLSETVSLSDSSAVSSRPSSVSLREEYQKDDEELRSGAKGKDAASAKLLSSLSPASPASPVSPPSPTSANSSTSSLASAASALAAQIPSHQRFSTLIHKHEVPRKVLHVGIGFLTLGLYVSGVQITQVTPILATQLAVVGTADFLRFRSARFNGLYIRVLGFLMREKEVSSINGTFWYLLGLVVVFSIFPKDICLIAVLLLSWADTAASTIGRSFGYLTPKLTKSKSLAGTAAAFAMSAASVYLIYSYFIPGWSQFNRPDDITFDPAHAAVSLAAFTAVGGVVGAVSELIDFIDDNLTIPIISATLMYGFAKVVSI